MLEGICTGKKKRKTVINKIIIAVLYKAEQNSKSHFRIVKCRCGGWTPM